MTFPGTFEIDGEAFVSIRPRSGGAKFAALMLAHTLNAAHIRRVVVDLKYVDFSAQGFIDELAATGGLDHCHLIVIDQGKDVRDIAFGLEVTR